MNPLPHILTELFPPDADDVLTRTAALVSDEMLEEISQADYGFKAEEHLAALVPIRDHAQVAAPMKWFPKEVLELVRWTQPEDPKGWPTRQGERGHKMRAFACAALLRSAAETESDAYFHGENQTLIQLIESALFLDRGLPEATGRFLTWQIPSLHNGDDETPIFVFGLVAITLSLKKTSLSQVEIDSLVSFLEESEKAVRDPMGVCPPEMFEGSFLDETVFSMRHAAWRALAGRVRTSIPESKSVGRLMRRIERA